MAHGFKDLGGNTTFVSRKEIPWHGLGLIVDAMTSKEAIVLGGLDYEVGLGKINAQIEDISPRDTYTENNIQRVGKGKDAKFYKTSPIDSNFATYRKDTGDVFGVVGKRFEVFQNTEAFQFFDSIIGEGHAKYETVGALGNGERVFITAKLPSSLVIGKDEIDKYLLLTSAHDGTGAIQVLFTPIRVVCNNTLTAALGGANKISIRHTKNARVRLEAAKKALGIVETQTKTMSELFNIYIKKTVSDEDALSVFKKAFNMKEDPKTGLTTVSKNKLITVNRAYFEGVGQEGNVGSAWGVFNGVTTYLQNVQKIKDKDKNFNDTFLGKEDDIRTRTVNAINELIL